MVRTVNDAFLDLRNELRQAGVAGFQLEARELICYALNILREDFHQKRTMLVFERDDQRIRQLVQRRLSGTPIQQDSFHALKAWCSTQISLSSLQWL